MIIHETIAGFRSRARRMYRRWAALTPVLLAAAVSSGCNQNIDLASLQKLSATADDQQPAFAAIAGDYYSTCQRRRLWTYIGTIQPIIARPPKALTPAQITDLTTARNSALDALNKAEGAASAITLPVPSAMAKKGQVVAAPVPTSAPSFDTTKDPCQLSQNASAQWQTINTLVLNYVRAVAALAGASSSTTNNSYNIDTLAGSLSNDGLLSNGQATAISTAASSVVRDIFNSKRRSAIAEYAAEADEALDLWLDRLEYVANQNYRRQLGLERDQVNSFFLQNFVVTTQGLPALESLQYRQTWQNELASVDSKTNAINGYVNTLESLRKAHHAIVVQMQEKGTASFFSIVNSYISEYEPQVTSIRQSFASASASPSPKPKK